MNKNFIGGLTTIIIMMFVFIMIDQNMYDIVCEEEAVVTNIIEVDYRTATVVFSNGDTVELNQPRSLKEGEMYCVGVSRKYNNED